MRVILAAILVCALGAPAAWANAANSAARSKHAAHGHVAKAGKSGPRHGRGLGGIHPLVGSGDY
jgi:hypothetical protein